MVQKLGSGYDSDDIYDSDMGQGYKQFPVLEPPIWKVITND